MQIYHDDRFANFPNDVGQVYNHVKQLPNTHMLVVGWMFTTTTKGKGEPGEGTMKTLAIIIELGVYWFKLSWPLNQG